MHDTPHLLPGYPHVSQSTGYFAIPVKRVILKLFQDSFQNSNIPIFVLLYGFVIIT
jgi:hypothetical protein